MDVRFAGRGDTGGDGADGRLQSGHRVTASGIDVSAAGRGRGRRPGAVSAAAVAADGEAVPVDMNG